MRVIAARSIVALLVAVAGCSSAPGSSHDADATGDRSVDTFSPCPPAPAECAIMPLGDSITDGFGTPGGYRIELFRQTLTAGRHMTFVGRNLNGPATVMDGATTTPFPQRHEGYSGYTIDPAGGRQGISPLTDAAISTWHPQIILLQIGTNDIDLNLDVANAPTRLGALLDQITTDAPDALLVVARITPLNYDAGNARVEAYNDAMPALVRPRASAGKHILLVDMYAPFVADPSFKTSLLADQWHPNPAGYALMAGVWYQAIQSFLR
jgi:lysophospholipase L1-like esterase